MRVASLILAGLLFAALPATASSGAAIVAAAAKAEGVDPAFALAIGQAESGLRCEVQTSPAGAVGVMQVLPRTALSVGISSDALRTCKGSAIAGVRYLKKALARTGGDRMKAAHLYLAGIHATPRASQYARSVMAHMHRFR